MEEGDSLMRRLLNCSVTLALVAALLLAAGCGKGKAPRVDARQAQINALKAKATDFQTSAEQARAQAEQVRTELAQLNNRLAALQTSADEMKAKSLDLQQALDGLIRAEQAEVGRRGWPWYVNLFLILGVVVLVFLLYKVLTRDTDEGEEGATDESYVEETDLGSVRYPGSTADTTKKE